MVGSFGRPAVVPELAQVLWLLGAGSPGGRGRHRAPQTGRAPTWVRRRRTTPRARSARPGRRTGSIRKLEQVRRGSAPGSATPLSDGEGSLSSTLRRTQGIAPGVVELGADRVELATVLVDHADRHQVDQAAVLDELAVVENSGRPPSDPPSPPPVDGLETLRSSSPHGQPGRRPPGPREPVRSESAQPVAGGLERPHRPSAAGAAPASRGPEFRPRRPGRAAR